MVIQGPLLLLGLLNFTFSRGDGSGCVPRAMHHPSWSWHGPSQAGELVLWGFFLGGGKGTRLSFLSISSIRFGVDDR